MKPFLEVVKSDEQASSFHFLEVTLTQKTSNWHYHSDIELTYVIEGSGIRLVGDHLGHFKQGDLMITGENLPHDFNMENADDRAKFLVIQFKQSLIATLPEFSQINKMLTDARHGIVFSKLPEPIGQLLLSFKDSPKALQLIQLFELLNQLSTIEHSTSLCSDLFATNPIGDAQLTRLNKVIDFVKNNYARNIELKEIAELSCMAEPSFCRWFKHTMDCSFVNYLNKCRVEQACQSLINTDRKVALIASDCGFESLSSFNRAFKKFKGLSPLQYKKSWNQSL